MLEENYIFWFIIWLITWIIITLFSIKKEIDYSKLNYGKIFNCILISVWLIMNVYWFISDKTVPTTFDLVWSFWMGHFIWLDLWNLLSKIKLWKK